MVHSSESSKLGSLCNGSASSEEKLETNVSRNGSYTDSKAQWKSKRPKVAAGSEFPSDCQSISLQLRSRTNHEEVRTETCEDRNVADDFFLSSTAEVELIPGENMGEAYRLKSIDKKLCNDMDDDRVIKVDEFHRVNMQEPMKDRNLPENMTELNIVEIKPPSISLPEEDVLESDCMQSIIGTKQLRGRTISVVKDLSPNMRSKISESRKMVKVTILKEDENSVLEKLGFADHLNHSLAKSIAPEVLEPPELQKSKVSVPKLIDSKGGINTKKGVAMPSPLKPSEEMNKYYGEGSRSKTSERVILAKGRLTRNLRNSNFGQPSGSSSGDSVSKVKETPTLHEEETRSMEKDGSRSRVDFEAWKIVKRNGKNLIIGTVPGVEVGDEFQYRMELNTLGIHRPPQGGIDYMKDDDDELVAMSIVASGGYDDELDNSDILIYTGQGGNVVKGKNNEPKDQQLITGNLALKNSVNKKNPVRVIRGKRDTSRSSVDAKKYVYDGLYLVEEYWQETGSHGTHVFKFKLRRIPGQPELSWKVVKKSKRSEFEDGVCNVDISEGKETLPICAMNTLDTEKPPPFIYTAKMMYPDWCRPIPPRSCGCTKRCSESKNCGCVTKNGGELPYNCNGAIVRAKPIVYECGPLCSCPPSCYMRVTQHGIKLQLEIFKTESRGWGVRSLKSIPSGSFICEYVGELMEDKEAERLSGKDEYLFDIGGEKDAFTIDAARKGNIGRFINHSCSPNLYAQDVLYDHEETRIPHVMFFAMENISPLEELTYDYNYKIDQVYDSNGNIKRKDCYCGSDQCTGDVYAGEWSNGQYHGRGVYTAEDGSRYDGEFKWDVKHGLGSYHFRNGDVMLWSMLQTRCMVFEVYQFGNVHISMKKLGTREEGKGLVCKLSETVRQRPVLV